MKAHSKELHIMMAPSLCYIKCEHFHQQYSLQHHLMHYFPYPLTIR